MSTPSPLQQPTTCRKPTLRVVPEPVTQKHPIHKQLSNGVLNFSDKRAKDLSSKAFTGSPEATSNSSQQSQPLRGTLHDIEIPLGELSNNALVLRCQNQARKDKPAFEELVNRYQRYVDKLLYHLASDWSDRADLAQEVWIRVYRSIHRLKEPTKFKSWLGRITTNLFYDELRKRKRFKGSVSLDAPRHSSDGQYDWELPSKDPTPVDTMMTQEFHDYLKTAMAELPEVFQKTIAMRELQGLSYEEIANITGVSLGTVKSRIARARQRLQEKLNIYLMPEKV
ncbi:MAG: sigma-70 family RNA polymerase sigma factor [Phormidesmis sp.]